MMAPLSASDFDLLATSDMDYGTEALFSKLHDVNRQIELRRPGNPALAYPRRALLVSPQGRCTKLDITLNKESWSADRTVGAYVLGRTDGSGKITHLELLYSQLPEASSELLDYMQRNLMVWGRSNPSAPIKFYGRVMGTADDVGYILAGAFETL